MRTVLTLSVLASLALAACAPAAPPSPTAAPPKPAATAAPAKPAATTAPAKPAATTAPAKPAATAAPAAKPTEKPAAKAPEFDEKAVADFYKGKTIRIVVGQNPGGASDTNTRLVQPVLGKYIPGNPSIVVENKPGGGTMLATNTVYSSEPKDGTVIVAPDAPIILLQALGAPGVQFDAAKINWLVSSFLTPSACAARTDSGINSVQDIMEGGKELTVSSFGKGTVSFNPPAAMNLALGTRFKIVTGYDSGAAQRLAVKNKEVQGFCTSFESMTSLAAEMFEGSNAAVKVIIVMGPETPNHPWLKDVPAAEKLAKSDEARAMLKATEAPAVINLPFAVAPEVPRDRVQALRRAFDKAFADPEFLAAAKKANRSVSPKTGEEVGQIAQGILSTPPATLAKLKGALE